ncbi:DUF262 domain-containing protein [Amycolatopsis magusensis]|uniref:DUF262 domain-containing protein n=1 Tax=Amycolatopsis magusensis TaxID=882444 RepID=UPI003C2EF447
MPGDSRSALTADALEVQELVRRVRGGQIRVPNFQRGLKWGYPEVKTLFDSILRDFPIGNLLLWQRPAPAGRINLGAIHVDAPETQRAWWVVDGQQRIISMYNVLSEEASHDDRFALSYDFERQQISRRVGNDDPWVIPFPVLFDLTKVLNWVREHPDVTERIEEINLLTTRLRQFRIPVYLVEQDDEDVLREIFDRMNNSGKKLTRAEVFSALNPRSRDEVDIPLIADRISQETNFGRIDDDTVLLALLARRGPNVQREIRLEFDSVERGGAIDFPNEDRETAYAEAERALRAAVLFLQETANVPHFSFLPYRYLLVVLTRFFGLHRHVGSRNAILLRRWFWRAALIGPALYRGSTTGTTRQLNGLIVRADVEASIEKLLGSVSGRSSEPLQPRVFRTNELTAKVILCSWWARGPRSPLTGESYSVKELSETVGDRRTPAEAVPRLRSAASVSKYRLWAANRMLVPDEELTVGELADDLVKAQSFGRQSWEAILDSHLMTPHLLGKLLNSDAPSEFYEERQGLVEQELSRFVAVMCENDLEDTPSLAELIFDDEDDLPDDDSTRVE